MFVFVHFSPLSLPCQRKVGGLESRKSKRRIVETQVSAFVSYQGEKQGLGRKPLELFFISFLFSFFFVFFSCSQGKQLPAIQITCQSDTVMKADLVF